MKNEQEAFRKWLRESKNIDDRVLHALGTRGTWQSYWREYERARALEEAVERIKDALGFEYFKLPPSDRNELLKEIQQWCETNVDKMKIPRGRRYDTIEDLHADDMLTSGKPWTKSRQPKTPYTEEEKWFAQTYGLPLRTVRRKLKKDGYICP